MFCCYVCLLSLDPFSKILIKKNLNSTSLNVSITSNQYYVTNCAPRTFQFFSLSSFRHHYTIFLISQASRTLKLHRRPHFSAPIRTRRMKKKIVSVSPQPERQQFRSAIHESEAFLSTITIQWVLCSGIHQMPQEKKIT